VVDARDAAAVAAIVATSAAQHAGKTYWLTGPGLISNYDVAAVLSRTITYRELSFDQIKDTMIRAGVAEMSAQAFTMIAMATPRGSLAMSRPSLAAPARSFEQFAADYAAAFS
jgi:hypothetical protein